MKSTIFVAAAFVASVAAAPSYHQTAPAAAAAVAPAGQYNNVATPLPVAAAADAGQYNHKGAAAAPASTPCSTAAAAAAPTPAADAYAKQPETEVSDDKYVAPVEAAAPAVPTPAYDGATPAYNGAAPGSESTPCDKSKTAAAALDAEYAAPTAATSPAAATSPCEKASAAAVPTAAYEQPAPAYGEDKLKEAKKVEESLYQTDKLTSSAGKVGASFALAAVVGAGLLL